MRTITQEELNGILQDHKTWIATDGEKGEKANLSGCDLSNLILSNSDLSWADLQVRY